MTSLVLLIISAIALLSGFKIDTTNHQFLLDDQPFRYLAGEIHYFRIPATKWEDRLKRVRSMGLNAITVPVPWNLHQIEYESIPDFTGNLDLFKFIQMAQDNGLYTLIRLGPYIADEFIAEVSQWWNYLLPKLTPLMRKNGGPILMAQIEHYYGSTGICDQDYLLQLANLAKKYLGNDVVLYSVDMPMMPFLQCGRVPGILPTIEMSPNSDTSAANGWFQQQQALAAGGPRVGSQFLLGVYKLWGTSVNDPFTEDVIMKTLQGDTATILLAIRNFINNIPGWPNRPTSVLANIPRNIYSDVEMKPTDTLIDFVVSISTKCWLTESLPLTAEDMNQGYGFLYYQTNITSCGRLNISKYADDAYVYLNGNFVVHTTLDLASIQSDNVEPVLVAGSSTIVTLLR
ncbi:unnamed protein product [Caenorhabditis sp. 36 PRJEB53466]|nr:unnamed protein product [Caenorhabditis sp. 36 PRJEB53466]